MANGTWRSASTKVRLPRGSWIFGRSSSAQSPTVAGGVSRRCVLTGRDCRGGARCHHRPVPYALRPSPRLTGLEQSFTVALADRVRELRAAGADIIELQTGDP